MTRYSIHIKGISIAVFFSAVLVGQVPLEKRVLIDQTLRSTGVYDKGAYTVTLPREEATIVWDDQTLTPNLGLNSWVAFKAASNDQAILTAQLLLLDDEVDAVLARALESGLEATGLAPSSLFDGPRLRTLDLSGKNSFQSLAAAFRACLDEIRRVRAANLRSRAPAPDAQLYSSISPEPLDRILVMKGSISQGAYKAVTGTTAAALHGEKVGPEMGMSTWVSFTGTNDRAVMHGDLVTKTDELQRVLRALSRKAISVMTIRNHTVGEQPQLVFIHFLGTGRAEDLAAALRHVLDVQAG
jgi:hypothetical protein